MRRLAKQTRNDQYNSNKDYQTLHSKRALEICPKSAGKQRLVFVKRSEKSLDSGIVAFGGFVAPSTDVNLSVTLETKQTRKNVVFCLTSTWNRIGLMVDGQTEESEIRVILEWEGKISLNLWGINADRINLPYGINLSETKNLIYFQQSHMQPETFYLTHEIALAIDINEEKSSKFKLTDGGKEISLKKCSYCGRLLPV